MGFWGRYDLQTASERSDLISNFKFMDQTTYATMFMFWQFWPYMDQMTEGRKKNI